MSTQLSIHHVTAISADHFPEIPSLSIEFYIDSAVPSHRVVLFCDDVVLNERLVKAINAVARERAEEKSAERDRCEHDWQIDETGAGLTDLCLKCGETRA